MVSGLIVGAMIALLCFIGGYFAGVKEEPVGVANDTVINEPVQEQEKELMLSFFQGLERENEILRMEIDRERMKNKKKATDKFRTDRGLLSYKKYIRE